MKRIFVDASKCDGCKNCSIACMNAHRKTPGTIYDLCLTDPENDPGTISIMMERAAILRYSAATAMNRTVWVPV